MNIIHLSSLLCFVLILSTKCTIVHNSFWNDNGIDAFGEDLDRGGNAISKRTRSSFRNGDCASPSNTLCCCGCHADHHVKNGRFDRFDF